MNAVTTLTWQEMFGSPEKIMMMLSAVGIAVGATAAFLTLVFVGIKGNIAQWNASFIKLYDEFWDDAALTYARKIIIYDQEYEKYKDIIGFVAFDNKYPRLLTDEEIIAIECLDKFFSKCVQFVVLSNRLFIGKKKKSFRTIFLNYWFNRIVNRNELCIYLREQWPSLYKEYVTHEKEWSKKSDLYLQIDEIHADHS